MSVKNALANISFDDFANMLMDLGALGSPAELHGLLCGQLSTGRHLDADGWLMLASTQLELDIDASDGRLALIDLYEQSLAQLSGFSFEFQPLLPTDETSLVLRTVARPAYADESGGSTLPSVLLIPRRLIPMSPSPRRSKPT